MPSHLRAVISTFVVLAATAAVVSAQARKPEPIPAGSASIIGTVVDEQSNQPLSDVAVTLGEYRATRFREVKTNGDGVFEFTGIADGEYTV